MSQRLKSAAGLLAGVPFALLYGLMARVLFGAEEFSTLLATMSLAFLFLVPVGVGALTVQLMPRRRRTSWLAAIMLPWVSLLLAVGVAGLLALEALVCIVMAIPVLLVMGSVGGVLVCAVARAREAAGSDRGTMPLMSLVLLGPLVLGSLEGRLPPQSALVRTETRVVIAATPDTVWRSVVRVPPIRPHERSFSLLFDTLGVPRPREARLESEGLGGVRRGIFDEGLVFVETITAWEEGRHIAWDIAVDDRAATAAPWREVGGRFFDVTGAAYRIEPLEDGRVVLHLDSESRLTTRFNGYGALWVRWGLGEFQREVLAVIKARAEAAERDAAGA